MQDGFTVAVPSLVAVEVAVEVAVDVEVAVRWQLSWQSRWQWKWQSRWHVKVVVAAVTARRGRSLLACCAQHHSSNVAFTYWVYLANTPVQCIEPTGNRAPATRP